MALLFVPLIFSFTKLDNQFTLKGSVKKTESPEFNFAKWFDGSFQKDKEEAVKSSFGFRNLFTRIDNQIRYSLFDKITAKNVIEGKDKVFYETGYLNAYLGLDFIGEDKIDAKIRKLKTIQDSLKVNGKHLLVVLAAGKASFYPEYFPVQYDTIRKEKSNYEYYAKQLERNDINHIDFNKLLIELKQNAIYPLYPKGGIHWSKYAEYLVADSLTNYLESLTKMDLPDLILDTITFSRPRDTDHDIEKGMNLLRRYDQTQMAYPKYHFEQRNKYRPSSLVVADSYYWGLHNDGYTWGPLANSHFWFYNEEVFPNEGSIPKVKDLNFENEVSHREVFILIGTEANLYRFAYGFIDNMHEYITNGAANKKGIDIEEYKVLKAIEKIKSKKSWYDSVKDKAIKNGNTLENQLRDDAIYFLQNQ